MHTHVPGFRSFFIYSFFEGGGEVVVECSDFKTPIYNHILSNDPTYNGFEFLKDARQ